MTALSPIRSDLMNSQIAEWAVREVSELDVVRVAEDLIRIPSQTEDEAAAVEYVRRFFERHGIEYVLQEVAPGRPQIIGRIPGRGNGRSLMLNGHLDNDSVTAAWQWEPFVPKR